MTIARSKNGRGNVPQLWGNASLSKNASAYSSALIQQTRTGTLRRKFIERIAERTLFHGKAAAANAAGELIAELRELCDPVVEIGVPAGR